MTAIGRTGRLAGCEAAAGPCVIPKDSGWIATASRTPRNKHIDATDRTRFILQCPQKDQPFTPSQVAANHSLMLHKAVVIPVFRSLVPMRGGLLRLDFTCSDFLRMIMKRTSVGHRQAAGGQR
jgi:hypothetical protein